MIEWNSLCKCLRPVGSSVLLQLLEGFSFMANVCSLWSIECKAYAVLLLNTLSVYPHSFTCITYCYGYVNQTPNYSLQSGILPLDDRIMSVYS